MKVRVHGNSIAVDDVLRAHLDRRLAFALSSFGDRVRDILVRFSHDEPARPNCHKRCEIEVKLHPRVVRVADTGADLFAAVENAADRAARSVARALAREHAWTAAEPVPVPLPLPPRAPRRR